LLTGLNLLSELVSINKSVALQPGSPFFPLYFLSCPLPYLVTLGPLRCMTEFSTVVVSINLCMVLKSHIVTVAMPHKSKDFKIKKQL
jgi:hypothetical protein